MSIVLLSAWKAAKKEYWKIILPADSARDKLTLK